MAQFGLGSNITVPYFGFGSGNTEGGNNGVVTVITYVQNFTGSVINSPITITNVMNIQVIEGGLTLTIIQDFFITNNTIVFEQYIENLNMTLINYNVVNTTIENQIKGGYRNTEEAKAAGLVIGDMYYLLQDNDAAQYSGVVVYIYE